MPRGLFVFWCRDIYCLVNTRAAHPLESGKVDGANPPP
jgi:hypothetical protein